MARAERSHLICRCLVIYSGIHYDVASVSPAVDATPEWDQTIFPIVCPLWAVSRTPVDDDPDQMSTDDSDPHLEAAQRLATVLRERRAFTNTTTFDLRCEVSRTVNGCTYHFSCVCIAMWQGVEGGKRCEETRPRNRPCAIRGVLTCQPVERFLLTAVPSPYESFKTWS